MRGAPSGQRAAATRVLRDAGVVMREGARVVAVEACADVERVRACGEAATVTVETSDGATTTEDFDVVAWTVGQRAVTPESWPFPRDSKGRIVTEDTLRVVGRSNVFALGDAAVVASSSSSNPNDSNPNDADFASPPPSEALPSTAQVAFQQADYAAWNVWSVMSSRPLLPFKYQHLGDMMTLGKTDAAVALPLNLAVVDGPAAAALRRAAYLYRMPTTEHRAKLAAEWIEQGARAALEEGPEVLRKLGVPLPPGLFPPPPSRE
jgi:NADH:ubiquinone reductase (non-electrogenic)